MKIFMDTLGCPKNMNDTQHACGLLMAAGHVFVENPGTADVVIVNTCGFIQDAKRESVYRILELAQEKKKEAFLVVTGCLSMRYSEELYQEIAEVDLLVGVNDYIQLPRFISELKKGQRRIYCTSEPAEFMSYECRSMESASYSMTLRISEGCDNHCTYCVIPQIRGSFRSRPMEEILSEANYFAEKGCREFILIAQDVTLYGSDLYNQIKLPELLKKLCQIPKIKWIRLMYCYEDRITDELLEVMASEPKICPYIDMPIQHLADGVLRRMHRRSTLASIQNTVRRLREKVPNIHIRTTLITGFPGESEEDFQTLLKGVEELKFERLGVFAYSQEESTPAGKMDGQIPEEEREARKEAVMRKQLEISRIHNQAKIGKTLEVLIEGTEGNETYYGRSCFDAPEIDNSVLITSSKFLHPGDFVHVLIEDAFDYDLVGRYISHSTGGTIHEFTK
jgi:ribosomal protein S12 methylthiotransferase